MDPYPINAESANGTDTVGEREKALVNLMSRYHHPRPVGRLPLESLPIIRPPEGCESWTPTDHHHQPLSSTTSIRLLKILPTDLENDDPNFGLFMPPVRCSMVTVDLEDDPSYNALSYTWGDPCTFYTDPKEISPSIAWAARGFQILLDGKPVSVGANLYAGLLRLRSELSHRVASDPNANPWGTKYADCLWIDALCINQTDHQERDSQVKMMSRIYEQAQVVFAWLGGGDQISKRAIVDLASVANIASSSLDPMPLIEAMRPLKIDDEKSLKQLGLSTITEDSWIGIFMFLNRAWFKRAWVVQEIAFAKNPIFLCGQLSFKFDLLMRSLMRLNESGWMSQIENLAEPLIQNHHSEKEGRSTRNLVMSSMKLFKSRKTQSSNPWFAIHLAEARLCLGTPTEGAELVGKQNSRPSRMSLLHLLRQYRSSEATDPRDKVYAFIGMSREHKKSEFQRTNGDSELSINYRASVADVYIQTAKYIISSSRSLQILSLKEQDSCMRLPSWVPDLSVDTFGSPIDLKELWTVSHGLIGQSLHFLSGNRLRVSGVKIAVVQDTFRFQWSKFNELANFLQNIPEFSHIQCPTPMEVDSWRIHNRNRGSAERAFHRISQQQSRFEVLWRTLTLDCFREKHPASAECGKAVTEAFDYVISIQKQQVDFAQLLTLLNPGSKHSFRQELVGSGINMNAVVEFDLETSKKNLARSLAAIQKITGHSHTSKNSYESPPGYVDFNARGKAAGIRKENLGSGVNRLFRDMSQPIRSSLAVEADALITEFSCTRDLFTTTDRGLLGLGPQSLKSGDEVWILKEDSIPRILRRVSAVEYRVVGEAYVHGIMHGEAVVDPSSVNVETVVII